MSDFKPGEQVTLLSGSPWMTVSTVRKEQEKSPEVVCHWYCDKTNSFQRNNFPPQVLKRVAPQGAVIGAATP